MDTPAGGGSRVGALGGGTCGQVLEAGYVVGDFLNRQSLDASLFQDRHVRAVLEHPGQGILNRCRELGLVLRHHHTLHGRREVTRGLRRERQAAERAEAGEAWREHGLVLTTSVGTGYQSHNLRRDFRRVTAAAGLGVRWVPKELRTSFVGRANCMPGNLEQPLAEEEHQPGIVRWTELPVDGQAQDVAVEAAAAVRVAGAQQDPAT